VTDELKKELAKMNGRKMSAAEIDAQRVSFAYGNAPKEDKGTKASVRRALRSAQVDQAA